MENKTKYSGTGCSPGEQYDLVRTFLYLRLRAATARYYLKWGLINLVVFAILMYDISKRCPFAQSKWYYLEYMAIIVAVLNGLACFCKYCLSVIHMQPLQGTEQQKKLLGINDDDIEFITQSESQIKDQMNEDTNSLPTFNVRWHFSRDLGLTYWIDSRLTPLAYWPKWTYSRTIPGPFAIPRQVTSLAISRRSPPPHVIDSPNRSYSPSHSGCRTPNRSYSPTRIGCNSANSSSLPTRRGPGSPYYSYSRTSQLPRSLSPQQEKTQNASLNSSICNNSKSGDTTITDVPFPSQYHRFKRERYITDEASLKRYLEEFARKEQQRNARKRPFCGESNNSVWKNCSFGAKKLRRTVYQLAPLQVTPTENKNNAEGGLKIFDKNSGAIRLISPEKLATYVGNLRKWISSTILKRLIHEIEYVDESFKQRGFHGVKIGCVSLERLKKIKEYKQFVNQYMPILPMIIPFLEISSNQNYLVQRIKDLAAGTYISNYCWKSGTEYHSLKRDEYLPSDSLIIFHLFCVYLDTQIRPVPQGCPFYNRYVILREEKLSEKNDVPLVQNKANCAILCLNPLKPKFNLISNGEIYDCNYDSNNLFHVIIQFLTYMRSHKNSCLEGISLGKNGINIMCVIED